VRPALAASVAGTGAVCGLAALGLGLYCHWNIEWFIPDNSFGYLVSHFYELRPITLVMIVIGGFLGVWLGKDASPLLPELKREAPKSETSRTDLN
jgi:hypothetical protein